MMYFGDSFKKLQNLLHLELDLSVNNLGENFDNIKYLAEGIKNLPNNMQHLELSLSDNKLGVNQTDMAYLRDVLK